MVTPLATGSHLTVVTCTSCMLGLCLGLAVCVSFLLTRLTIVGNIVCLLGERHGPLATFNRRTQFGAASQGRVRGMFSWISPVFGSGGSFTSGNKKDQHLAPREKLQAFHQLAKEAFDRAYDADAAGKPEAATKLYRTGLEAVREALKLHVEGSGLGPKADSVAAWKAELARWQQAVLDRLRVLESGGASSSAPVKLTQPHLQGARSINLPVQHGAGGSNGAPARQATSLVQRLAPKATAASNTVAQQQRTPVSSGGGAQQAAQRGAAASAPTTAQAASRDDQKYRDIILGEVLTTSPSVKWEEIAGLGAAKQALMEAVILPSLRPDLFQGLRAPVRGILLYGPPGNGKTMLGKALASEARATFFNISASSLTSKWVGEGEKLVRALFEVAAQHQPSIIFIDEIDSILSSRGKQGENDAARRLLTEFLVQFDGVGGAGRERVVVIGATNRPGEIDDAVRRRLTKRVYVPLPDPAGRASVLQHLLRGQATKLTQPELSRVVRATEGYSASDLAALCKEAAMVPVRELGARIAVVQANQVRAITLPDFAAALEVIKPSVNAATLKAYEEFTRDFGAQ